MQKQRARLADYYQKPARYYLATFNYITHKKSGRSCILLTNLCFSDENGKKIPMRSKQDYIASNGRHYIADHVWVNLTLPWSKVPCELLYGDLVLFKARVEQYKITRQDVLQKRTQIYNDAKRRCDAIFYDFSYEQDHNGYDPLFNYKLKQVKKKQEQVMQQAKQAQAEIELVDYGLNYVSNVTLIKQAKTFYHVKRGVYNAKRFTDKRYTNYLAWHSMDYYDKRKKH